MWSRPFRSDQIYTRTTPHMPAPFGLFGGVLFICGLIAIGSFFAPSAVEQAIPGWRERMGALVMIGVVLGFIRSIWRLFIPILGVAFWVVAVLCLWRPELSTLSRPLISSAAPSSSEHKEQPRTLPAYLSSQTSLPPALPDSAYFAPHSTTNSLASGVGSFMRRVTPWRL